MTTHLGQKGITISYAVKNVKQTRQAAKVQETKIDFQYTI